MLISLLQTAPLAFLIISVILIYSLALHEFGHAWVADKVGDKTARNLGRVTLNPLKHLDVLGTLLLFVVGFGWAKPVPIQPANFRNYRSGLFWVSIAGVAINFLIALLALIALALLGMRLGESGLEVSAGSLAASLATSEQGRGLLNGLFIAARINILLVVFNLLPIPPLDGSKVVQALAPESIGRVLVGLERFGFFIVIGLVVFFDEQLFAFIDGVTFGIMRFIFALT